MSVTHTCVRLSLSVERCLTMTFQESLRNVRYDIVQSVDFVKMRFVICYLRALFGEKFKMKSNYNFYSFTRETAPRIDFRPPF